MGNAVEDAKALLQVDHGRPSTEWHLLEELLESAGPQADDVKRWVFAESPGFVETRVRIGLEYLREHPSDGQNILRELVTSSNPDHRDTAMTILRELREIPGEDVGRALLQDPWPYLRFEAIDMFKDYLPSESIAALKELLSHNETWVRDRARSILADMGISPQGNNH